METIISPVLSGSGASNIYGLERITSGVSGNNSYSFMKIFEEALNNVEATESISNTATESLLNNTIGDLHTVMIDLAKAELTLGLTLQIRNKVLDSYNEIMRMQI